MRRLSSVLILLMFSRSVMGGGIFTLREALQLASEKNLTLQSARQELGVFEGKVLQAKAIPNPEVDASITKLAFHNPSLSDGVSEDYTLQQTIEIPGKRGLRTRSARSELAAENKKYRALELDVTKQVKEAYWDYSLADEKVNFALENLKFQQRFLSRVQDNFQTGQATLADLTRVKVEVDRATSDVLEAKKDLETGKSHLNRLMGQHVRQELLPPDHLKEIVLHFDEDHLIQVAQENRPEKASLDKLKEGSEADVKLARRLLWAPDLKAQVLYQKGESIDNRDSWGGGLGLVFPLWNRYRGERVAATAKLASLQSQSQDLGQQIVLEVHEATLQLNLSKEQLRLWKDAVDQATEATRLAEQRYLEGEVDLLVFFQTRRDLVNTTLQYLTTLRDYQVNLATLERAVGTELGGSS